MAASVKVRAYSRLSVFQIDAKVNTQQVDVLTVATRAALLTTGLTDASADVRKARFSVNADACLNMDHLHTRSLFCLFVTRLQSCVLMVAVWLSELDFSLQRLVEALEASEVRRSSPRGSLCIIYKNIVVIAARARGGGGAHCAVCVR
jgi:hypothetical protein